MTRKSFKDPIWGMELSAEFVSTFKEMNSVGWKDFLDRLEVKFLMALKSATTDEERAKVQSRVLLIDELRNFSQSLFNIDSAT